MTVDVKDMGVREYLGQGEYWIDPKTQSVFQVSEMDQDRRVRAARNLARMSTALISMCEADAAVHHELAVALHLAHQQPREWMIHTPLYRALYPEPAGAMARETGNHNGDQGVVPMYGVPRSA